MDSYNFILKTMSKQLNCNSLCSHKHYSLNQGSKKLKLSKLSPNSSILNLQISSNRQSSSSTKNSPFNHTSRTERVKDRVLTNFTNRNMNYEFEVLKNRIKKIVIRMKYKDKLNHIEMLIK